MFWCEYGDPSQTISEAACTSNDTYMKLHPYNILGKNSGADAIVRQCHHLSYSCPPVASAMGSVFDDAAAWGKVHPTEYKSRSN